jgi:hypothetical protein
MSFNNFFKFVSFILFLVVLFAACKNAGAKNEEHQIDSSKTGRDTVVISEKLVIRSFDTATIISALKSNPAIPSNSEFEVVKILSFNTGDKYVLVNANTGTCARAYFLWFDKNNSLIKCAELEANCDSDLSRAIYRYKTMSEISDTEYYVEHITQAALDSSLITRNGHLKDGHSLDDVKCRNDTASVKITPAYLKTDSVPNWPQIWK